MKKRGALYTKVIDSACSCCIERLHIHSNKNNVNNFCNFFRYYAVFTPYYCINPTRRCIADRWFLKRLRHASYMLFISSYSWFHNIWKIPNCRESFRRRPEWIKSYGNRLFIMNAHASWWKAYSRSRLFIPVSYGKIYGKLSFQILWNQLYNNHLPCSKRRASIK